MTLAAMFKATLFAVLVFGVPGGVLACFRGDPDLRAWMDSHIIIAGMAVYGFTFLWTMLACILWEKMNGGIPSTDEH